MSLSLGASLAGAGAPAGIKLDGSLGGGAAVLPGPNYGITQNLGKLAGGNLFFSFQYFNVATGETALFTTTSPGINNVISRVTGGFASTIDGTIALHPAFGAPNFFFINPSGVTFTANAKVDVPAAFEVTTAAYLKFADGNFYANPAVQSTLSTAAPEAFGFLGTTRAPVNVTGATLSGGIRGAGDFQIAAGDVTIDGAGAQTGIVNSGGAIRITAVGSAAAEVPLSGSFAATDGTVTIRNGAILFTESTSVAAGGGIQVDAGSLLVDGGGLSSPSGIFSFAGVGNAGPISVAVGNDATLTNGGEISSATFGPGAAGQIQLQAGSLMVNGGTSGVSTGVLDSTYPGSSGGAAGILVTAAGAISLVDGGEIASSAGGSGNAGSVSVNAQSLTIDGQNSTSMTGIAANTYGTGNSGQIQVQVGSLSIDGGTATNFTGISDQALLGSAGAAGDEHVTVAGAASIVDGGQISSSTSGTGNAGNISLSAQSLAIDGEASNLGTGISANTYGPGSSGSIQLTLGALSIDGGSSTNFSGISSTSAIGLTGAAGDITVNVAGNASIVDGGQISSSTFGSGSAGNISLNAQTVAIGGQNSSGVTGISSDSYGSGNAGGVAMNAQSLDIAGQSVNLETGIAVDAYGSGSPGQVKLQLGSLSIDGGNSQSLIGISSQSNGGSTGSASDIAVAVTGAASIVNGGEIASSTFGARNAGTLTLSAQSLTIDGQNSTVDTGIVDDTFGAGSAGQVKLQLGSLSIDGGTATGSTGIFSSAQQSTGSAGGIIAAVAGNATLLDGGGISSSTFSAGNAGQVSLQAGTLTIDGGVAGRNTGIISQSNPGASGSAGQVTVAVVGTTSIANGGELSSSTFGAGSAGQVGLQSGSLTIDGGAGLAVTGIISQANSGSSGSAGEVAVNVTGNTSIANGGEITSSTFGTGSAGQVTLQAGSLSIDGGALLDFTGIASDAQQGTGSAGKVIVQVSGAVSLVDGGEISSSTFSAGNAGRVTTQFGSLTVDGGTSAILTGILSQANPQSSGSAGDVGVTVAGSASISHGGVISSATFGAGSAGAVTLQLGSLTMSGAGSAIESTAEPSSAGSAGDVGVTVAGGASIGTGAEISSSTFSIGNAGRVMVQTGSLMVVGGSSSATGIDSQANPGATGSAGDVAIAVAGSTSLENGGVISTSTFGPGSAGQVSLKSGSLLIDGGGFSQVTGIASSAQSGSSGAAGAVTVEVGGSATVEDGGVVSTKTLGSGVAGDISVTAGSLTIGGGTVPSTITSAATAGSGGQTGRISLSSGPLTIDQNGSVSLSNAATVNDPNAITATQISIAAASIEMNQGLITTASTGNVAASAIDIHFGSLLRLDPSTISTTSNDGNGGSITLEGSGPLLLIQSDITTSVLGTHNGNGGDIDIDAPVIVLDTGAIQANTLAPLASGGTILIDSQALVPSFESLVLGGRAVTFDAARDGLNVIQAAAPDGVSGTLHVTAPIQYLGNSLLGLTGRPYVPIALGRGLCGLTRGSSLAVAGHGGMPISAEDPLGIGPDATMQEVTGDPPRTGSEFAAIGLRLDRGCR